MKRKIFFTSDQHFGHDNVIKFCDRPYKNIKEMNEDLIKKWNKKVNKNDLVYVLGDFVWTSMKKKDYREIISRLNGKKILVIGNHDKLTALQAINLGFDDAMYECRIRIGKEYVLLSHYPYRYTFWQKLKHSLRNFRFPKARDTEKRPRNFGGWLLHGHTHSKEKIKEKMIHIGVDSWDYSPVSINQIVELMERKCSV